MRKIYLMILTIAFALCSALFLMSCTTTIPGEDVYVDPAEPEQTLLTVSGYVTCEGEVLSGVTVTYGNQTAITMKDGKFILRSASSEGGKMTFSKEGYFDLRRKVETDGFVDGNQTINVELTKCYFITGVVTDSWGNKLSGVKVSSGNLSTYTDANGKYKLDGLFASDRLVTYSLDENYNQITRVVRGDWYEDGKIENFDVFLHRLATLSGTVKNAAGAPLAGVKVTCGSATCVTDENGEYLLTGIYPEPKESHQYKGFDVEFALDGYKQQVIIVDFMINFNANLNVTLTA